jgi:hypothetical protein
MLSFECYGATHPAPNAIAYSTADCPAYHVIFLFSGAVAVNIIDPRGVSNHVRCNRKL